MQLSVNFKSVVVVAILIGVVAWVYTQFVAPLQSSDVAKLIRAHRGAEPARQAALKHRIMTVYKSAKDYATVKDALDSPSSTTQALAVEILAEKVERNAVPKLLDMLNDPDRAEPVRAALANAMGSLAVREAIPRLVEMTDKAEPPGVRAAAHHALLKMTGAGAQVKLGESTREQWTLWLRSQQSGGTR